MSDVMNTAPVERDIETVTREIQIIKRQAEGIILHSAIEIGRRLREAKAMVPFGEWGQYLAEQVEFSQSTANNMMRLAEEYGDEQISFFGGSSNSQTLQNLNYTKALRLLAIPEDERDAFVEEHNVEEMSTRELEQAIREREAFKKDLEKAVEKLARLESEHKISTNEAASMRARLEQAEEKAKKAKEAEKKAKSDLKEAKENPDIPPDLLDRVRIEAEGVAAQKAEAEKKEALLALEAAKRETAEIADQLARTELEVRMANPNVAIFKTIFENIQEQYGRLLKALADVSGIDAPTAEKLKAAVIAMLKNWEERL